MVPLFQAFTRFVPEIETGGSVQSSRSFRSRFSLFRYNLQFSEKQPSSDRVTKASSVSEETQTASSCARESSSSEDPGRVDFTLPNADEGCPSGDDLLCESKNEDFVEALDYLDLTDPQNMQLYNNILEQMVMDDDDDDHDDQNNSDNEQRRRQCPKPSPDSPKDHVE